MQDDGGQDDGGQDDGGQDDGGDRPSLDDLLRADDGTHAFFSAPLAHEAHDVHHDSWVPPTAMSTESRRAMWVTGAILAVSVLGIGSYLIYHKLVMPTPVALGASPVLQPIEQSAAALQESEPAVAAAPASPSTPVPGEGDRAVARGAAPAEVAAEAPGAAPDEALLADDAPTGTAPLEEGMPEGARAGDPSGSDAAEEVVSADGMPDARPTDAQKSHALPMDESGMSAAQVEAYHTQMEAGADLQKNGHFAQALEAYEKALTIRPTASDPLAKIAYLHLNARRHDKARDAAERAVAVDPTNSEGWIVLGAARQMLRDREGALAAYRACADQGTGTYVTECKRLAR